MTEFALGRGVLYVSHLTAVPPSMIVKRDRFNDDWDDSWLRIGTTEDEPDDYSLQLDFGKGVMLAELATPTAHALSLIRNPFTLAWESDDMRTRALFYGCWRHALELTPGGKRIMGVELGSGPDGVPYQTWQAGRIVSVESKPRTTQTPNGPDPRPEGLDDLIAGAEERRRMPAKPDTEEALLRSFLEELEKAGQGRSNTISADEQASSRVSPESANPLFQGMPVIVTHLEHPPGSGQTACCGKPFTVDSDPYPDIPRVLCTGCLISPMALHTTEETTP